MPDYFTEVTLDFLAEAPLRDRAWLQANRQLYEEHFLQPQRALAAALSPFIAEVDPGLSASPSRIYRDTRFQRLGPPLRGSLWITFHDRSLPPEDRPAFFFELYPDRHRYGMGFYSAGRAKMERLRQAIDQDPGGFLSLVNALGPAFQLMGDSYRRSRATHLPPAVAPWYDRKSFWVQVEQPNTPLVLSPDLARYIQAGWEPCIPLYCFLRRV